MKVIPIRKRLIRDQVFYYGLVFLSSLIIIPLFCILFYVCLQGFSAINWAFFTSLPKPVGELGGGVSNAIVGSFLLVSIATLIAVPLGVFMGIFVVEYSHHRLAKWARISIDTLQGVPSIVIGIIAYVWVVKPLGSFSLLSGAVSLSFIMLPLVAKSTEETLSLLPNSLKEAAYALGAPYYRMMLRVILPSCSNGIMVGVLLGVARICGETAPLLFTAFGNPFMNFDVLKPVHSLPLLIFNYAMSPYEDWQQLAWGASLVLILFVLVLSLFAKAVLKR